VGLGLSFVPTKGIRRGVGVAWYENSRETNHLLFIPGFPAKFRTPQTGVGPATFGSDALRSHGVLSTYGGPFISAYQC